MRPFTLTKLELMHLNLACCNWFTPNFENTFYVICGKLCILAKFLGCKYECRLALPELEPTTEEGWVWLSSDLVGPNVKAPVQVQLGFNLHNSAVYMASNLRMTNVYRLFINFRQCENNLSCIFISVKSVSCEYTCTGQPQYYVHQHAVVSSKMCIRLWRRQGIPGEQNVRWPTSASAGPHSPMWAS